ncbi:MAG: hypothetical protein RIT10_1041 [Bacteroidota bacterium]|jgi:hypothetical protein
MKFNAWIFLLFALASNSFSQKTQSPSEYFGYELGTYFTRHHQVVDYFKQLEKNAPSTIKLEKYGATNEKRDLIVAYISTPENLKNLEQLKQNHSNLSNESVAFVWLSYNVHGNESAGTEAAMQTAFELITQRQDWLKSTVVILDPCINPDGRDRYVNWYNQQYNKIFNTDRVSNEHNEPWPSGRPNHYLFDLNRDWAWLTQVESKQRIALYNQWLPHVHVDFHEQGMNNPYYFAPAAEPYHEVITNFQRSFQTEIGKNNAKYFDKNGWLYFTKEIFDLLYPSYGDTYPTYSGAVGMTYEQGGSGRGGIGVINSEGKLITLKDRLLHHHTAGLSTVEHAAMNASKLIQEFQNFSKNKNYRYKSYVVGGNQGNLNALKKLLDAHKINYNYGNGATVTGFDYTTNKTGSLKASADHIVISTNQLKGTLVNVLFEPKTALSDSLTYDITAWSLPYAYGLEAIASEKSIVGIAKKTIAIKNTVTADVYAYLANWNSFQDARFLSSLLQKGYKVRMAENPFTLNTINYNRGTLIITKGDNAKDFEIQLMSIANEFQIQLTATATGMVEKGNDFGSSTVKLIKPQTIALLTDENASSLNVGEVWHYFEEQLNYPISLISTDNLDKSTLSKFTSIIVPEGYFDYFSLEENLNNIKEWIANGGKLISIGGAVDHFTTKNGFTLKAKNETASTEEKKEEKHEHAPIVYNQQEREAIKNTITGAIFSCQVEQTNPLAFGYSGTYNSLKLSASAYELLENQASVVYTSENAPILGGFVGCNVKKDQNKSLIIGQENRGNGSVIYFIDNPLFRGFWENGKLFFANALFMTNN